MVTGDVVVLHVVDVIVDGTDGDVDSVHGEDGDAEDLYGKGEIAIGGGEHGDVVAH